MIEKIIQEAVKPTAKVRPMPSAMQQAAYAAHMALHNAQGYNLTQEQSMEVLLQTFAENIIRQCAVQAKLALLDEEKVDVAILKYYNLT